MPKRSRGSAFKARPKRPRRAAKYRTTKRMSKMYRGSRLQVAIKRGLMRMAETKEVLFNVCTNQVVNHNQVVNLFNNAFECARGAAGEQFNAQANNSGARIGNNIFIKGVSVAINIEAQQYRPKTHWKIFLVRNKENKDNSIGAGQLYEGHNTNITLDWLDTAKVDILFSKKFNIWAPNVGTSLAANTGAGVVPDPPGTFDHESSSGAIWTVSTNPSWRGRFYVPVNMNVRYVEDGVTPAVMRYQWVIQAYDNYGAPSSGALWSTYPLGHVSMTTKMLFKDV